MNELMVKGQICLAAKDNSGANMVFLIDSGLILIKQDGSEHQEFGYLNELDRSKFLWLVRFTSLLLVEMSNNTVRSI